MQKGVDGKLRSEKQYTKAQRLKRETTLTML